MSIHTGKDVFIIPYWIINTVERNNLPLTTVLDLEKLSSITSAEDLALTVMLNEHNERVFGVSTYSHILYSNWFHKQEVWAKYNAQIKPLESIVFDDLENRLFNQSSKEDKYKTPYEIKDIDQKTFLIIIYPGYFGGDDSKKHQENITKDILKLFFVNEGYDDMARRQLFEQYLNQL